MNESNKYIECEVICQNTNRKIYELSLLPGNENVK